MRRCGTRSFEVGESLNPLRFRILEGKGHLKHRQEGRDFIYQPMHARSEVGQSTLRRVIGTFFGGSLTQALAAYLSHPQTQLSDAEVAELRRFLDQARKH